MRENVLPDAALVEKKSVKNLTLANCEPQVVHVEILHIEEVES